LYLPRRYDDYTQLSPIAKLQPNAQVTVIGVVRHTEIRAGSGGRKDYTFVIDDGSALLSVMLFGQGQFYMQQRIRIGQQLVLRGITSIFRNRLQMTNPDWEELDADDLQLARIVPVYSLTEGLRPKTLRDAIRQALDYWAERIPDYIPEATLERTDLADLGWTLNNLHFPESWDHLSHAKRRYVFDELLLLQHAILSNRFAWQSTPADPLSMDNEALDATLQAIFPYTLTSAQRRAIEDIRGDIAKPIPMNRLLQGDVGSGKTAVAVTALAIAFSQGKQAALMAPTGILAEQHYRNVGAALAKMPGERKPVVALLTGSLTAAERDRVYAGLADGSINVVIGTHAIIQSGVEFADLGLIIIDEQHRFGVKQRARLKAKSQSPELLTMTATPIPRTLAMTMHGDLDVSEIDELPPGRKPIMTKLLRPGQRRELWDFVLKEVASERQVYVVFPLIEESESLSAKAATKEFEKLKNTYKNLRFGLMHGKLKPQEKDEVMDMFRDRQYDVLVSTTVIEVGVDVPNATTMIIENADRFGLAQLHQLRGRVGRGSDQSYCFLLTESKAQQTRERLEILTKTNDGFVVAEKDLEIRGPGEFLGYKQSGLPDLILADLVNDATILEDARNTAIAVIKTDPELETSPQLRELLDKRLRLAEAEIMRSG
ncbi:MAG: ATP-dependent DNA helicase RecG, partial [Cyanobacteria bacterium HKST-UBA02]|nr:ATP-dependent DNA helicase RecG [Cyanobacteria bacterium HKST-UBA02]